MSAAAIFALFLAAPASAGKDCVAALESALRGRPRALKPCLADKGPVERLLAEKPALEEGGLRVVHASSPTVIAGAHGTGMYGIRRHYLFVPDGPPPWRALTVYRAARPWPEAPKEPEPQDERALWAMVESFNVRFSSGDVDSWMLGWTPEATFVSAIGPFIGPEVRTFFEHQALRYEGQRMRVSRALIDGGQALTEGAIAGRCRGSGRAFELPFLMLTRLKGAKTEYVYEAFTVDEDGCGPFWTLPR